ncbi:MAG: nucleotide sugar dehydrogenase [Actinomycetota bacterium]
MNIAVFGLGYVGTVTAACLSGLGHRVTGVDPLQPKVDALNDGRSPVLEPGVEELLAAGLAAGRIHATTDVAAAVAASELALICVGTPSRTNGDIDLRHIEAVSTQIGQALAAAEPKPYTVVIRSTVLPGTAARAVELLAAEVGERSGVTVAVNPEFLREGQGVDDFRNPPLILVGADNESAGQQVISLYDGIDAERRVVATPLAELVKYANNSWHAAKVTFANEIGVVAQALGVDGRDVMDIVCSDTKLNISPAYLRPGFAFGGSCLPKDVRAITFAAKSHDVATPLLSSLLPSNSIHTQRVIDQLIEWDRRRIGFVGLAFKPGTDDLRESPLVEVVERMIGKGFDCVIHDQDLSTSDLIGSNRAYIEREIPHLSQLLQGNVAELVADCDVLVVSKPSPELLAALAARSNTEQIVVDLAGLPADAIGDRSYWGVAW